MKLPSGPGVPAADAAEALTQALAACRAHPHLSAPKLRVSGKVGGQRLRGRLLAGLAAPASAYLEAPAPFGAAGLHLSRARRRCDAAAAARSARARARPTGGRARGDRRACRSVPADLRATLTGCAAAGEPRANATHRRRTGVSFPGDERALLCTANATPIRGGSSPSCIAAPDAGVARRLPRLPRATCRARSGLTSSDRRRFDLRLALVAGRDQRARSSRRPSACRSRPARQPMTLAGTARRRAARRAFVNVR